MLHKMIGQAFGPKIERNFINGLKKFASESSVLINEVQVRITPSVVNDQPALIYHKAVNWQVMEEVTFKRIMDLNLDLLNLEANISPAIFQIIAEQSEKLSIEPNMISAWMFLVQQEEASEPTIMVFFYNGTEPVKGYPILELFETEEEPT